MDDFIHNIKFKLIKLILIAPRALFDNFKIRPRVGAKMPYEGFALQTELASAHD